MCKCTTKFQLFKSHLTYFRYCFINSPNTLSSHYNNTLYTFHLKRNFTPYIYIILFLGFSNVYSQKLELKVISKDSISNSILESIHYKRFHTVEKDLILEIDSVSVLLQENGYLNNHLEKIENKDFTHVAHFTLGEKTKLIKIYFDSTIIDEVFLKDKVINVNKEFFTIPLEKVSSILNEITGHLESQGNTFVEVSLKNITQTDNKFSAELYIKNLNNRTINNIVVKGFSKFPKSFTNHYLNLKENTIFNSKKVTQISNAINSLPFVTQIKPPEILFTKDSTSIYLFLKKKKSNLFDGLIGFSTNDQGKLEFNGHFDILLNNAFNSGETISVKWKSNGQDQKLFNLKVETPYIFNSRITPKASFDIYKQDSTFLNTKASLDLKYAINPKTIIAVKYQSENSNNISSSNQFSSIEEFKNNFYGISFEKNVFDKKINFQNKFFLHLDAIWGNRILNSLSSKTSQSKYEFVTYYNWFLNNRNSIFIQNQSALLFSDDLFTNELFRIGGTNSIRGFNEHSIFTSSHSILNLEYRYHLQDYSFLYSITDFAYIANNTLDRNSQLYSFGLGYQYNLKSGVINLSYAIGKELNKPLNINNSRFHVKFYQFF